MAVPWLETDAAKRFIKPPSAARVLFTCVSAESSTPNAAEEPDCVDRSMEYTEEKVLPFTPAAVNSVAAAPAVVIRPFVLVSVTVPDLWLLSAAPSVNVSVPKAAVEEAPAPVLA